MNEIWHPFTRYSVTHEPLFPEVIKAKGAYLYLRDGRRLFDAISSWWTIIHGHGNPTLRKAVEQQLKQLDHVIFAGFTHTAAEQLATTLSKLTKLDRVFFSDNGSTAVEVALKLAIQFEYNSKGRRNTIYALEQAYHGDTFGAMSAAGENLFSRPFKKYMFQVKKLPIPIKKNYPVIKNLFKKISREKPLAFIYEPLVQGAGGMLFHDKDILNEVLYFFRQNQSLLIADEVFTGFYRTGSFLASEQLAIRPDILALAKGITGGFLPLGVSITHRDIFNAFRGTGKTFYHGHSYTAYPAACAAAVANLTLLSTDSTQSKMQKLHHQLANLGQEISQLAGYYNIRHLGGILAFEIGQGGGGYNDSRRDRLYDFFIQQGILLRPLGNTVYLVPPLCTEKRELQGVLAALRKLNHPPQ